MVAPLIDPPNPTRSAPHHAAHVGGEGMTGSRYWPAPAGDSPALMSAIALQQQSNTERHSKARLPAINKGAPTVVGVKALRPRTRSGFARALTPTTRIGALKLQREGPQKRSNTLDRTPLLQG